MNSKSLPNLRGHLLRLALLSTLSSAAAADLVGHWQFDDPADLGKATIGSALALTGTVSTTTGPADDAGAADFAKGAWAAVTNPIAANGSSGTPARTNQFSIVVDFQVPDFTDAAADNGGFTGLFDFDNGGSDGDYFIRKQAGAAELGVSGQWPYVGAGPTAGNLNTTGTVRGGTWYRMVLSVDNGVARTIHLNGNLIGNYGVGTPDAARQSLSTTTPWRLLWDNDGETSRAIIGNLALFNGPLTAQQIGLLGVAGDSVNLPTIETLTWSAATSTEWSTGTIPGAKNWKLESDGVSARDFENLDTVVFGNTGAGTVNLSNGDVEPTAVRFESESGNYTLAGSGAIIGAATLSKSGVGKLTITNENTFSGATQITEGDLVIGHEFALQNSVVSTSYGAATQAFGAITAAMLGGLGGDADLALVNASNQPVALTLGGSTNASYRGMLSGGGSITKVGSNRQAIYYDNTYTGGTTIQGGAVVAGLSTALGTAPVTLEGGVLEFEIAPGSEGAFPNDIILPDGAGNLSLFGSFGVNHSGPSPFTATRLTGKISGGSVDRVFRMSDTNITGEHDNATILDNPANDFLGTIELWRGTIGFTSDAAFGNVENDIKISTENLLGSLRFEADNITLNAGRSIQLYTNTNPMPINTKEYTGIIAGDFSGVGKLVKQGTGTLILTGTNNATGTTDIVEGTMRVDGSFASGGGTVTASTGTLAGNGSIARTVAIAAGGKISPGASIGTLGTGTTTIAGTYVVEVDGANADKLVVTGDLDVSGGTLEVSVLAGGFTQSSYVIGTYSGTQTGAFATITPGYVVTYGGGQIVLKQGTASAFETWAGSKGVTGFDTDSDGDGISNGIEFVIGGEPAPGAGSNSAALLPTTSYQSATQELVFVFRRTPESGYLNPAAVYSTSLNGVWTAAPAGTVIGTQGGADLVEVRLPASLAAGGKIFVKLKASE